MKLQDFDFQRQNLQVVPVTRGDNTAYFTLGSVASYAEFDAICPAPKPGMITRPGKGAEPDLEEPSYKDALSDHNSRFTDWLILKSLEATEGLEWEKVDMSRPDTWKHWRTELQESGLLSVEITRILRAAMIANSLDEEHVEAARKSFLASQAGQKG